MDVVHLLSYSPKPLTLENKEDDTAPELFRNFKSQFTVYAPGSINLLGAHTCDSNGFTLQTAIDKFIQLHFAVNNDPFTCNVYSKSYNRFFSFDLRKIARSEHSWENYILGVVNEIQKRGKSPRGFDCIIESDLPVHIGLSSSAALECGVAFGINELFNLNLSRSTIAEISWEAQHNYVGEKSGIVNQHASVLNKEDHLMLLDCRSLEVAYVPTELNGHKLLLLFSLGSQNLAPSVYETRRDECEDFITVINKIYPEVRSLRDVTLERLQKFKDELPEVLYQRAHYVISENDRVLKAVEAIKKNDLEHLGLLMYASHKALRDHYEVSCEELDFLVDLTTDFESVKGSSVMGGSFGGCTVNLIEEDAIDDFVQKALEAYQNRFNIEPEAIIVSPERGTYISKK